MNKQLILLSILFFSLNGFSQATYFGFHIPKVGSFGDDTVIKFTIPANHVQRIVQIGEKTYFQINHQSADSVRPDSVFMMRAIPVNNKGECSYTKKAYSAASDSIFQYRYYSYGTTIYLSSDLIFDNLGNKYANMIPNLDNQVEVSVPANAQLTTLTTLRDDGNKGNSYQWYPVYAILDHFNALPPPIGRDTIIGFSDCLTGVGVSFIPDFIKNFETKLNTSERRLKLSQSFNLLEVHGWVFWRAEH